MPERTGDSTSWLIDASARVANQHLAAKLRPYGVTPPQWNAVVCLAQRGGQTLTQLARLLLAEAPTMTSLADRLEANGLVERRRESADRRVIHLYLTAKGRKLVASLPEVSQEHDQELLAGIEPGKCACFLQTLRKVIENLQPGR